MKYLKAVPEVQAPAPKFDPTTGSLLDEGSTFRWVRGADVQKTWRKYGWIPPTETKFKHVYTDAGLPD